MRGGSPGHLVGRDFARARARLRGAPLRARRWLPALIVGALIGGLALASLRIENLRLRYALAESIRVEKNLLEESRVLTARVRTLRDPVRLARLARERGFTRPTRVVELSELHVAAGARP